MSDRRILQSHNVHGNVHASVTWINDRKIPPEMVHSIIPVSGNYTIVVIITHARSDGK